MLSNIGNIINTICSNIMKDQLNEIILMNNLMMEMGLNDEKRRKE